MTIYPVNQFINQTWIHFIYWVDKSGQKFLLNGTGSGQEQDFEQNIIKQEKILFINSTIYF